MARFEYLFGCAELIAGTIICMVGLSEKDIQKQIRGIIWCIWGIGVLVVIR